MATDPHDTIPDAPLLAEEGVPLAAASAGILDRLGDTPAHTEPATMKQHALDPSEWRSRCARRIAELDPDIALSEAQTIAQDVYAFERTRAMAPEAAADFIAEQMSRSEPPKFERRSKDRDAKAPMMRSILRFLSEPGSPRSA